MKKVNLTLFRPPLSAWNCMNSYMEVIESLQWGFLTLGYECAFRLNEIDHSCVNIVFGFVAAINAGNAFPPGTILYNMEQYAGFGSKSPETFATLADRYQIFDYCQANVDWWLQFNPRFRPYYARVSYAPCLTRIEAQKEEDIDLMFIGAMHPARAENLFNCSKVVSEHTHSIVSLTHIWGKQRDEFIARAKVMLNLSNPSADTKVFEIVRVSYYLANRKAVVCESRADQIIESDMKAVLRFGDSQRMPDLCAELLQDLTMRRQYAQQCFEVFAQRDVRDVINGFFS